MKPADLVTWREQRELTQVTLAARLGVSDRTLKRWEHGDTDLPDDLAERLKRLEEAAVIHLPVIAPNELQPGAPGWRYKPGTVLPKGVFVEVLPKPERYPSGALVSAIEWCSNGVGLPSMRLVGSIKDYTPPAHGDGYHSISGGIERFKPADGSYSNPKKPKPGNA